MIDIYIYEVTRRLPEKSRSDIALELRSSIEDMLPEDYTEKEIEAALEQLGDPAVLAKGYSGKPSYLIGPALYDPYIQLLKMILPIAVAISFIATLAVNLVNFSGEESVLNLLIEVLAYGIATMVEVAIQTFFWFTVVFAVVERVTHSQKNTDLVHERKTWKAEALKDIVSIPEKKRISRYEVFGTLLWTAVWVTLYYFAEHLIGIYEGQLEFITPALNQDTLMRYWPVVVVIVAMEAGLAIYMLIKKHWTKGLALFNSASQMFGAAVFVIIMIDPKLFNNSFIQYLSDLFSTNPSRIEYWIITGSIFIVLISVFYNIANGIKRAKIN